jgi:2-(3-amino-3-carboxypropyl)histidine synthase
MNSKIFDFEETRLQKEILKRRAKRVLIQLPEGLKTRGSHIAVAAEKAGATAIISADPCYGACDLALSDAELLGADLIIHYGHSETTLQSRVPTVCLEAKAKVDVYAATKAALPLLEGWKKIGLVTTVQHIHTISKIKKLLRKSEKAVVIGKGGGLTKYVGQVIGCDYSAAKSISNRVESFLFFGGGRFHAIGVSLATAKPTIVADPFEKRAYSINKDFQKVLKQRWASIHDASKSKKFGILIGLKSGQNRFNQAFEMKKKLEKNKKRVTLLSIKEITPEVIMQFPDLEAFVNTACPRISIDNASKFVKPILTINEVPVMLGELKWDNLCKGGWF